MSLTMTQALIRSNLSDHSPDFQYKACIFSNSFPHEDHQSKNWHTLESLANHRLWIAHSTFQEHAWSLWAPQLDLSSTSTASNWQRKAQDLPYALDGSTSWVTSYTFCLWRSIREAVEYLSCIRGQNSCSKYFLGCIGLSFYRLEQILSLGERLHLWRP